MLVAVVLVDLFLTSVRFVLGSLSPIHEESNLIARHGERDAMHARALDSQPGRPEVRRRYFEPRIGI